MPTRKSLMGGTLLGTRTGMRTTPESKTLKLFFLQTAMTDKEMALASAMAREEAEGDTIKRVGRGLKRR